MDISEQISAGKLRCVRTNEPLALENGQLTNRQGKNQRYTLFAGKVPIILKDQAAVQEVLEKNPEMTHEYAAPGLYQRIRNRFYKDYVTKRFCDAREQAILSCKGMVLSIGGGPARDGPNLTNLNIGPFPNVDIVGDAHDLPYCDGSVDAIYCHSVLEHVERPIEVVREMKRVLKQGGKVLSVIPFMQAYHGYPSHFQNFTLTGHEYLYASNGFKIVTAGVSQGPIMSMTTLNSRFWLEYLPPVLNQLVGRAVQLIGLVLRPLDRLLENHPKLYVIASSTYVLAEKP